MSEIVKFLHEQREASPKWTIRLPVSAKRPGIVELMPTEGDPLDLLENGFLWRMTRWLDHQTIEVDFREPVTGYATVAYEPITQDMTAGAFSGSPCDE